MARILIHAQHLLGTGHLRRAAVLARALAERGHRVHLLSGGMAVPGLEVGRARLVQLPPCRAADAAFRVLLGRGGRPVGESWRRRRRRAVLEAFGRLRPDVVITELYPFGRRMLRFELEPLIAAALARRRPALLVCSLRDVIAPKSDPRRVAEVLAGALRYDAILVHGDPGFIPLEATFPKARAFGRRLRYTGYIVEPPGPAAPDGAGSAEVIVSVGGGAAGERLLAAAVGLAGHRPALQRALDGAVAVRVLAGGADAARRWSRLVPAEARTWLRVEPNRPDFRSLLERAVLSVSQAGYNTCMDLVAVGARSVLVPFAEGGEREQTIRARALAARGVAEVLPESRLTPETLLVAIVRALRLPKRRLRLRRDGAQRSARVIERLLGERRARGWT